ncbi:MerR family transcriptional regulator [Cellulomonas sp. Y8]|uniref:DNA polymerase III subunit beta family protein n=1 Tax=Cellulomonas sp. Y8 TaxID=2591145 RepID=UPI0011C9BAF1|nr:MerR family transcriptional regulator [Cellulomonas sp. Y8]
MTDDLLSIGALARASGLPVSALRYYDAADVLRPAHVDPATGYRWYTAAQQHTARLLARLRQAGLPVADLVAVLAAPHDATDLLARHRRRLEDDLAAAGAHLDAAADLLAEPGRGTLGTADLLAAVAAVRHAVGADPAWPALAGVLLHLDGATLRVVGCDRFRLAVATVPVREPSGPEVRVVATLDHLDRLAAAAPPPTGQVVLGARSLDLLGVPGDPADGAYPDYERVLRTGTTTAGVATRSLVAAAAEADDLVVLRLGGGRVRIDAPGPRDAHAFCRTFLLDAVRAARAEHLTLALDDDGSPLGVSPAGRPGDVGLVMPVRLRA